MKLNLKSILGGRDRVAGAAVRYFRPTLEVLEDRQLLSASAISNLMNVPVTFNLSDDGHLTEITGGHAPTPVASGVQGLYQGQDVAGHQVAFEWTHNHLYEFTPNQGWQDIGAASQVTQDASHNLFFLQDNVLHLATGTPAAGSPGSLSLLPGVQSLMATGGQTSVQIGPYLKASLNVQLDAAGGGATLTFSNVQLNLKQLLGDSQNGLTSAIKPFADAAQQLTSPIPGLPSWTHKIGLDAIDPLDILRMAGYETDAQNIQEFVDSVNAIESLTGNVGGNGWMTVTAANGNLSAHVSADGSQITAVKGSLNSLGGMLGQVGLDATALNNAGVSLPVLQDSGQLVNLLLGKPVDLIKYNLQLNVPRLSTEIPLADFPTPIPASDVQVSLHVDASASAAATIVLNSVGLQSGNLAKGLSVQKPSLDASLNVGLSGTYWEGFVVGYRVTGKVGFQIHNAGTPVLSKGVDRQWLNPFVDPEPLQHLGSLFKTNEPSPGNNAVFTEAAKELQKYFTNSLGSIAKFLYQARHDLGGIARALYAVTPNFGQVAYALGGGINGLYLKDIASALSAAGAGVPQAAGAGVPQIVDALWHSGVVSFFKNGIHGSDVVAALWQSRVSQDLGAIAQALARNAGLGFGQIAYALGGGSNGLYLNDIASALRAAGAGVPQIVDALWHSGVVSFFKNGFNATDVVAALWNSGISHDPGAIAQALARNAGLNLRQIAYALGGGINGTHLFDIAKGLRAVDTSLSHVVDALWNSGVAGFFPNSFNVMDLIGVLWNFTKDPRAIASALVGGGTGLNMAQALAAVGLGGGGGLGGILDKLNPVNWRI